MATVHKYVASTRSPDPGFDSLQLSFCSILILIPLKHQYRRGNLGKKMFDVPLTKIGMKPDIVPAPEGLID